MNLKEFLKAEREERKERKKLKKQKKTLTKEEKKHKIFGIVFGIVVTIGAIIYSCNNLGSGYSWNNVLGITDEMIVNLEQPVDERVILPDGKINQEDSESCMEVLSSVGIDFDENFVPINNFNLTDRQLGAIAKELIDSVEVNYLMEIYDLDFYLIGETIYQKSVVYLNLSNLIIGSTLPSVYLTTISKVEILNDSIICMNNSATINTFDEQLNEEIMTVLNENSNANLNEIGNNVINAAIEIFIKSTNCSIAIVNNLIEFKL